MSDIYRDIPSKVTAFVNLLKSYPIPTDLDITVLDGNNYGSNDNAFVKVDQHFGIDATQLPALACQFRSHYTNLRKNPLRLTDGCFNKDTVQFNKDMMDATKSLLCVCPDNATAWGDRSRSILFHIAAYDNKSLASCLEHDGMMVATSLLQEELQFLNFLFTRHSSKPSPWSYRKWIFKQYIQQLHQRTTAFSEFLNLFLPLAKAEVTSMVSVVKGYPKNYYAWSHKIFMVQTLLQKYNELMSNVATPPICDDENIGQLQQKVLDFLIMQVKWSTEEWLPTHVSDHSAVHYGAKVLHLLIEFRIEANYPSVVTQQNSNNPGKSKLTTYTTALETIQSERNKIVDLIEKYPKHEALWLYRRYCCLIFLTVVSNMLREESESFLSLELSNYLNKNLNDEGTNEQSSSIQRRILTPVAIEALNENVQEEIAALMSDTDFYSMTFCQWVYFHLLRLKLVQCLYKNNVQLLKEAKKVSMHNMRQSVDNHNEMWKFFEYNRGYNIDIRP